MENKREIKNITGINKGKSRENDIEKMLLEVESLLAKPDKCLCGEDFEYCGLGIYKCKHCGKEFKNEYGRVRDFVDENGTNYNIEEIAAMTNVPRKLINLFIKDGRFDTVKKQKRCMICRNPIEKGQYCNRCALKQIKDGFDNDNRKKMHGVMRDAGDMKGEMHYINKKI